MLNHVGMLGLAAAVALSGHWLQAAAAPMTEEECIRILQSDAAPREKDAACASLKRIGTVAAIPALSNLLDDERLSHSARLVLESMSAPAASRSLIDALERTSGSAKAGIATSLGLRGEPAAVPGLAIALRDSEPQVAEAAAAALGDIGSPEAIDALRTAMAGPTAHAIDDALLRSAHRLLAMGKVDASRTLFAQLHGAAREDFARTAAFRGILLTAGDERLKLACAAIGGPSGPDQAAALQFVHALEAPGATTAFGQLLLRVPDAVRIALIQGLEQRNDPLAAPLIAPLAGSPNAEVRTAVLTALGQLGDHTSVDLLITSAATATGTEQKAARDALVTLRRGQVAEALLGILPAARPPVQAEIARALAARRERTAVLQLQSLATKGSAREAAVVALGRLAIEEPAAFAALVELVLHSSDESGRTHAAAILRSVCEHIQFRRGVIDPAPLVYGLDQGSTQARISLLPVCARISDAKVSAALRRAAADANPEIRDAAVRAMCDTADPQLLPDLIELSAKGTAPDMRLSVVAAAARLSTDRAIDIPDEERIEALERLLAASPNREQRELILSALTDMPELGAVQLAAPMLEDPALRNSAALALIEMSPFVADRAATVSVLERIHRAPDDRSIRAAADRALRQTESGFGFVTVWQVAAPFRQTGRDFAGLFDLPFRPESAEARGPAGNWRTVSPRKGETQPWRIDLRTSLGADASVGYARVEIRCDRAQAIRLEFGTDSAAKIWLNDKLVHASIQTRAMRPNADAIAATLEPGPNGLLIKLVQPGNRGMFCLRVLQSNGEPLAGVQINPAGGTAADNRDAH